MKRLILTMMVVAAAAVVARGQEEKSTTLKEVAVKAARTVQKEDGMWLYPTRQQLESSTDGYSLLAKLALPRIRVDEAANSITALTNLGSVQVRINDVVATREDLLAMDMRGVQRVEFIDNPGLRYGEGIAYVINIKVRKPDSGYVLGSSLSNTLTTALGDETLYARVNRGRSEFSLTYGLDYHRLTGEEYDEQATYHLGAASGGQIAESETHLESDADVTETLHRHLTSARSSALGHKAQLAYCLSDSNYVLQARLSADGQLRPTRSERTMEVDGTAFTNRSSSRATTPSLDIYYHQDFRRHQSLTANAVGTYIKSRGHNENNEGGTYAYDTHGRTRSLWTEGIYENRLRPFTLSTGIQFSQRYSHNTYEGDAEATNDLHVSGLYLFSQLKGKLGRLSYVGGVGGSHRYYSQGTTHQHFWLFRPKFTVSYALTDRLQARYGFELSQHVSQIALISDVSIKQNRLETLVGNPNLRPNRVTTHDLHLTYTTPRLTLDLQSYARLNANCNLEQYSRVDGHFYQTQSNADNQCNLFYTQLYSQWQAIPEKLSFYIYGGLYRFYNRGEDYRHTYNAFNGGASVQAYLGKWTLSAYADNGWHFMEGEHRGYGSPTWVLTASYRLSRAVTCSLFAQQLFASHPVTNRTELLNRYIHKTATLRQRDYGNMITLKLLNRYIHKTATLRQRDYGNMITLKLAIRLDHGRHYRDIQRTMEHQDTETGILSTTK
ncbi:MAG: hypothetical protein IJ700_00780 [Bacteroidaceae bacterium]|nr:hypothetical protein [Bacteroidaceae bacterium]